MKPSYELPTTITANTADKSVAIDQPLRDALPGLGHAYDRVNSAFEANPEAYLAKLQDSIFSFTSQEGAPVACSLLYKDTGRPLIGNGDALVIFAPFSDGKPNGHASDMSRYITSKVQDGIKGVLNKEFVARPNSWNQTTKSAVVYELLGALGKDIPVLTIYSPVPLGAYSPAERALFASGDYTSAAKLAAEALKAAQSRIAEQGGTTDIERSALHLSGASLGATNAIGAGAGLVDRGYTIKTVTAQELILGPKNLVDLMKRFVISKTVGAPAAGSDDNNHLKIQEPALRTRIDGHGSEIIGTNLRMVKAMAQLPYMQGLTKPEKTVESIKRLLDNNVDVLVALAENSALTKETAGYLHDNRASILRFTGEKGQYMTHLSNEYVALSSLTTVLNILRRR